MGIVGLGRMGRFHAAALAGVQEVDLVAGGTAGGRAGPRHAVRPRRHRHQSVAEGLAHAGLEAVLVAASTPTHPEIVAAALDRGSTSCARSRWPSTSPSPATSGRRRRTRPRPAGRLLAPLAPPGGEAKARIDAGDIGTPLYLRLAQWDADPPPPEFCDPAVSGGLAIDCGVHEFDLAEWLTGRASCRCRPGPSRSSTRLWGPPATSTTSSRSSSSTAERWPPSTSAATPATATTCAPRCSARTARCSSTCSRRVAPAGLGAADA